MQRGRPTDYTEDMPDKVRAYIVASKDEYTEFHKTRGEKSDSYDRLVRVNIPTIEGLAIALGVNKSTIYEWEKSYEVFSDALDELRSEQKNRLIQCGLSGDYNPLIAKLVLSANHGMKERTDMTSDEKPLNITFDNAFTPAPTEDRQE